MVRCWPSLRRRRRKKSKKTRIRVKPATPPTTLPTNVGVEGILSPPDPAAAAMDDVGGAPAVPVGPPKPPGAALSKPELDALAEEDEDDKMVEDEDNVEDEERVLVANVELVDVMVDDWMRELEELRGDPNDVEFEVRVTRAGIVVTRVDPETVSDEMIAAMHLGANPALDICGDSELVTAACDAVVETPKAWVELEV
ncbi:MAG: hypothetical protein Q9211_000833 [Gyalolechia sp. 1 TL-2023]